MLGQLRNHTDVLTAEVSVEKAKYNLKLQKLVPLPDVDIRLLVQKDYSTPPKVRFHPWLSSQGASAVVGLE